jgi:hypothetical protein
MNTREDILRSYFYLERDQMMKHAFSKSKKNHAMKHLGGELGALDQTYVEPILTEWAVICKIFFKLKLACNYMLA